MVNLGYVNFAVWFGYISYAIYSKNGETFAKRINSEEEPFKVTIIGNVVSYQKPVGKYCKIMEADAERRLNRYNLDLMKQGKNAKYILYGKFLYRYELTKKGDFHYRSIRLGNLVSHCEVQSN